MKEKRKKCQFDVTLDGSLMQYKVGGNKKENQPHDSPAAALSVLKEGNNTKKVPYKGGRPRRINR